jgi:DNA helicase HerA-like ATPase
LADMMQTDGSGKGVINILAADKLMAAPRLYATFLLWLLSELYETLPEVGDLEQPKFVFFFDEAHLLFTDAPKVLLERIELIVRLVRSKGVGVYFVTQNPLDIPDSVLAQLGNRIQHALRAFTPRDQKAVKATAETMRQNPKLDIETAITELAVGEALVSLLDEKGRPSVTERVFVIPPASQIGAITSEQRTALIASSIVAGAYEKTLDRESAYEKLTSRAAVQISTKESPNADAVEANTDKASEGGGFLGSVVGGLGSIFGGGSKGSRVTPGEQMVKSAASAIGREVGRQVLRGVLGSIFKGR